jgi:hypothetical protein
MSNTTVKNRELIINNKLAELNKAFNAYKLAIAEYENEVRKICDFDARITYCVGDGHLVMNADMPGAGVATLECLEGKTVKNMLTAEQHYKFCF